MGLIEVLARHPEAMETLRAVRAVRASRGGFEASADAVVRLDNQDGLSRRRPNWDQDSPLDWRVRGLSSRTGYAAGGRTEVTGGGHNEAKFKAAILALSNANDWDDAKAEWYLHFVYEDPNDRACECEHSPIHQICVIRNRKNSKETEVGNVCVRRFLRLVSNRIFAVIRRLRNDINKSLNPVALDLFQDRGVLTAAENAEYKDYWRKRISLTKEQRDQKFEINTRVLDYVDRETAALIAKARALGLNV